MLKSKHQRCRNKSVETSTVCTDEDHATIENDVSYKAFEVCRSFTVKSHLALDHKLFHSSRFSSNKPIVSTKTHKNFLPQQRAITKRFRTSTNTPMAPTFSFDTPQTSYKMDKSTKPSTKPSPLPTSPSPPKNSYFTPDPTDPNLFTVYSTNNRHRTPAEKLEQERLDELKYRRDLLAQKQEKKAALNDSGIDVSESIWDPLIKRTVERVLIADWRRW